MKRLLVVAVSLLVACATSHVSSEFESGDAENAIRTANSAFMTNIRSGNIEALVNDYYVEDAVVMPQNAPAFRGRDSIKQLFTGLIAGGGVDVTLTTDTVTQSCDMATEVGHYDLRHGATHEAGKYLVVWKKTNGKWRAIADSFSANGSPQ